MKTNLRWGLVLRRAWFFLFFLLGIGSYPSIGFSQTNGTGKTIFADVIALDQVITYNRFGSFNPNGMIYALRRDVVEDTLDPKGNEKPIGDGGKPGSVMLRKNKRPRPLVLRVNKGDTLVIRFKNLLSPLRRGDDRNPPEKSCGISGKIEKRFNTELEKVENEHVNDAPATRCASIVVSGLTPIKKVGQNGTDRERVDMKHVGISGIPPGSEIIYRWYAEREGTYLFFSNAAPAGGEGDGGSLVHGLFGAVHVEPEGSVWYRSQVTEKVFEEVLTNKGTYLSSKKASLSPKEEKPIHPKVDYKKLDENGDPVLNILKPIPGDEGQFPDFPKLVKVKKLDEVLDKEVVDYEVIYGDLNAIVQCKASDLSCSEKRDNSYDGTPSGSFREFTVIFHDELKTVHPYPFGLLNDEPQLSGIRDGFAINYGASGLGTILLANRNEIGPAEDCVECFYEEFFLQSWANGDPALLVEYPKGSCNPYSIFPVKCVGNEKKPHVPFEDDPSNVHHSYLGDNVKFRNLHAGPKETHVFHLHAHQWLSQGDKGVYLDSQTIGPEQGFSYNIFYGGGGNRNLTPGDSIFHCHLYPHFAQGMWELWRVHDVFEDGSRHLPDGEMGEGTNPETGTSDGGTPVPALVPMQKMAMAPMPQYGPDKFPGYPFYIPGERGHRAPQPPMDMALDFNNNERDGGLPRHIILSGEREGPTPKEALASGNFRLHLETAKILLLPGDGTRLEKSAMAFHALNSFDLTRNLPTGDSDDLFTGVIGYRSETPDDVVSFQINPVFRVNGLRPKPGAPFADPCPPSAGDSGEGGDSFVSGVTETSWWAGSGATNGTRNNTTGKGVTYKVSAIELDMVVNSHGWHDPQARINVLDGDVVKYQSKFKGQGFVAEPFFFRAHSGDCITFEHTNRTPDHLQLDDFQVATPTDIIGQHIHLVKFDVTSSDGSANGWNYEDGTFARDAIIERIEAANAPGGGFFEKKDGPRLPERPLPRRDVYQTTVQRWWADPLTGSEAKPGSEKTDHTIRTVFTHDHFAPSSIQQHGFYGALVIEPRGSEWFKPDGTPLVVDPKNPKAVGTRAIIQMPELEGVTEKEKYKDDYREFMLAIADFALLYDPNTPPKEGTIRPEWGNPVDPPSRGPEAISTDHHNPYLLNYKHDPIPLRIGNFNDDGTLNRIHPLKEGKAGEMAHVFDSNIHGDPFLKPFNVFEGDEIQIRVIQGAQEVQHTMTINGLRWQRNIGGDNSPYVNAQEIGISEHFELKMPIRNITRGSLTADYLIHFGSVDDLWNGAWGLIRSFEGVKTDSNGETDKLRFIAIDPETGVGLGLKPLRNNPDGKVNIRQKVCPSGVDIFDFTVKALAVKTQPGSKAILYNLRENIYDRGGLRFLLTKARKKIKGEGTPELLPIAESQRGEPLVLRATAGSCIKVHLKNELVGSGPLPKGEGNAELPTISSLRADDFPPSNKVSLHPQLLTYDVIDDDGTLIGHNTDTGTDEDLDINIRGLAGPGHTVHYTWYAGIHERDEKGEMKHVPKAFGAINLTSFGDVIKHGTQGLVGALIIEPKDATITSPVDGSMLTADIEYKDEAGETHHFREFVVIYQDGLNLHKDGQPILDCHICDDSYDLGEKAINYRTEPFWARLGMPFETCINEETGSPANCDDTNYMVYPENFFLKSSKGTEGGGKEVETNIFKVEKAGDRVRFRVLQPAGRARQRSFQVYGHDYDDYGIPNFGSAHSSLISVGKGITANLRGGAKEGCWIYRDGPNFMFSGGAWGLFEVGAGNCDPSAGE